MISFLKRFKNIVREEFQIIILGVIGIYALIVALDGQSAILSFFEALLPISLILFATLIMVLKSKYIAAHLILLVVLFANGLRSLLRALLSYHFFFENFQITITIHHILSAIVCAYLLMMIVSYAFDFKEKIAIDIKPIWFALLVFSVFSYFCFGFNTTILYVITAFILVVFGSTLGAMAILLSYVINQPLNAIGLFVDEFHRFTTIYDWVIYAASIYVIYVLVITFIKEYKKDPIKIVLPVKEVKDES